MGVNYRYKIASVNYSNKETSYSDIKSIDTYELPKNIKDISYQYNEKMSYVFLSWSKNTQLDFSHYLLTINGKDYEIKNNFYNLELIDGEINNIKIVAVNKVGLKSSAKSISIYSKPKMVNIIKYEENHGEVKLYWEDKTNYKVDKYVVYRDNDFLGYTKNCFFIDKVPVTGKSYKYTIQGIKDKLISVPNTINIQTNSIPAKPCVSSVKVNNSYIFIFKKPQFIDFKEYEINILNNKREIESIKHLDKNEPFSYTPKKDSISTIKIFSKNMIDEKSEPVRFQTFGEPLTPKVKLFQEDDIVYIQIKDISKNSKFDYFLIKTSENEQIKVESEKLFKLTYIPGKTLKVEIQCYKDNTLINTINKELITHSIPTLDKDDLSYKIIDNLVVLSWKKVSTYDFDKYYLFKTINGEEKLIYQGIDNTYVDTLDKNTSKVIYKFYWKNNIGLKSNIVEIIINIK